MPNRVIKDSIKRSPQIDSLTWFEEVVFYRLMVSADDYGCFDGRTVLIKNELFPAKETVTTKSVNDAIDKLASVGLLCKYTVNGMPYLFFPTWEKHQRIRNKRRKYPEPPAEIDLTVTCCQMSASCLPESESNPNPNPESEVIVSNDTIRRTDVQRAIDAWNQLELSRITKLVEGTDRYKQLKKRIKDYGIDTVLQAIQNVGESDFLCGRSGDGKFVCTFDWMIKPNNFPKVLDGNYANKRHSERVNSYSSGVDRLAQMYKEEFGSE